MRLPRLRRRPLEDDGELGDRQSPIRDAITRSGPFVTKNHLATKLFLGLLVLGLLTGPFALLTQMTATTRRPVSAVPPPIADTTSGDTELGDQRVLAEGAAMNLGWRWAEASSKQMTQLAREVGIPPDAQPAAPQSAPPKVLNVTVVDATPQSGLADITRWQVSILIRGGAAPRDGRTYLVLVDVTGDRRARPVTLPGQIPAPSTSIDTDIASTRLAGTHPLTKAATGWAEAMVAGKGDLDPWLSPGTEMAPIRPAVCAKPAVSAVAVGDEPVTVPAEDEQVQAAVTIACNVDTKKASTVQYLLEFQGRDGRWEISRLAPPPAAAPTSSASPSATTATPSATASGLTPVPNAPTPSSASPR